VVTLEFLSEEVLFMGLRQPTLILNASLEEMT